MSATGQWNVTINSPMGAQQGTLDLTVDGATVTGTMAGPQGTMALEEGAVNGETLTWAANVTSPRPIKLEFSAQVSGDEISGTVKLGAFGNATFSGSRAYGLSPLRIVRARPLGSLLQRPKGDA